jgi:hypothetical protein
MRGPAPPDEQAVDKLDDRAGSPEAPVVRRGLQGPRASRRVRHRLAAPPKTSHGGAKLSERSRPCGTKQLVEPEPDHPGDGTTSSAINTYTSTVTLSIGLPPLRERTAFPLTTPGPEGPPQRV